MYEDLAYIFDRQGQARQRDWFLVLAADAAHAAGSDDDAERLRKQLLSYNPHHLLKPFRSFADAVHSSDIQNYIADLRRAYPPEAAEQLLETHRPGSSAGAPEPPPPQRKPTAGAADGDSAHREEPPIFRLPGEPAEAGNAPLHAAPRSAPAPAKAAARPARPQPRKPAPLAPQWDAAHVGGARAEAAGGRDGDMFSYWVSSLLFLLVLAAGAALLVYTFGKPFFPAP
jgi:hypothetical protein